MTCEPSQPAKMGRPREWDREVIAQELIEWAKRDDAINLNKFCCTREPPLDPCKVTSWAAECEDFRKAYRTAKAFIAMRREEWLATDRLHQAAYNRNSKVYDVFEKLEGREEFTFQKELEAKVGKETGQAVNADIVDRLDRTLAQITSLQSSSLNSATSRINKEEKS